MRMHNRNHLQEKRELDARRSSPELNPEASCGSGLDPEINRILQSGSEVDQREKSSSEPQSTDNPKSFWDYMTAKDAPKAGFWPWMHANETRFSFCMMFFGIFGILAILLILRYLQLLELAQMNIDAVTFVYLVDVLLAVLIVMLIPIGVAYSISGKRKN